MRPNTDDGPSSFPSASVVASSSSSPSPSSSSYPPTAVASLDQAQQHSLHPAPSSSAIADPPSPDLHAPAATLMSLHGQTTWPESSSAEPSNAPYDAPQDHDMSDIDVDDGGAALTDHWSTHHADTTPPTMENVWDNTDTPWTGPASPEYSADGLDEPMSFGAQHGSLHNNPAPFMPAPAEYPALDPPPPPTTTGFAPFTGAQNPQHMYNQFGQIAAIAQQEMQQVLVAQMQAEIQAAELHAISNPNHLTLGPDNLNLVDSLRAWARLGRSRDGQPAPRLEAIIELAQSKDSNHIGYDDLRGDEHDFQGINWQQVGVARTKARDKRRATYKNYVNKIGSDKWNSSLPDQFAMPRDSHYRFQGMHIRRDVRLLHFQLRNLLACASRTRAFFPSLNAIAELDPTTGRARKAMDFGPHSDVQVSTVAATAGILLAGSFLGDYRYRSLDSENRTYTEGKLTEHISGITNHVQIHSARRSSAPIAAFASNDFGFRTVDLATNKLLFESMYQYPLNCSAISTDQRLRVMVGDHTNVLITDAESGKVLQDLSGHRDFGFACDWAPDGWTVATGFQDKSVRIWDARRWTNSHDGSGAPVAVLRMDMSGARSLHFSPLGSGKRLLVAAEEADVVNIFDAQTFNTQQKLEMFGEIGGTAFADGAQTLMALNADPHRGGVIQFDKCDGGAEDTFDTKGWSRGSRQPGPREPIQYDWRGSTAEILGRPDSLETMTERRRRAIAYSNHDPF